jgi:hypothetical protein
MLKTMKRRFTHKAVANTTHIGAPAMISGSAASCELPANTSRPIINTSTRLKPDLIMPGASASMSLAPMRNSGCL